MPKKYKKYITVHYCDVCGQTRAFNTLRGMCRCCVQMVRYHYTRQLNDPTHLPRYQQRQQIAVRRMEEILVIIEKPKSVSMTWGPGRLTTTR